MLQGLNFFSILIPAEVLSICRTHCSFPNFTCTEFWWGLIYPLFKPVPYNCIFFPAPCKIPVKKAVVLYNGEKKRVQNDLKDGILHGETVSFFCKNKEKSCAYTVDAACVDGNFTLPACFKGTSQAAHKAAPGGGITAAWVWGQCQNSSSSPTWVFFNYWVFELLGILEENGLRRECPAGIFFRLCQSLALTPILF